ncbi:hypothetical protein [Blattabacterium cuenoti]|uniref:hypothetical protein n=1 Tax=Blattabacterium cuenoti TaxID=1653831 RepID=UPI00163B94FF|nr:hypothetical protein [Blattabacterium cuenoti]
MEINFFPNNKKNSAEKFIREMDKIPHLFSALKKIEKINMLEVKKNKNNIYEIYISYIKFFIEGGNGTYIISIANWKSFK